MSVSSESVSITNKELVEKIGEAHAHGVFYSVTFEKRSDKSQRTMVIRGGVKKGLKPRSEGEPRKGNDPTKYGLMNAFSIDSDGWRCFGLDQLLSARIFGVSYVVKTE
jgi:hypothetical protein